MDITFKVEEQNRNQFTFGGGVSGLEGTFINASFSTTNFLGAGETFQVYLQPGKRSKNYSLSVSEPYFLDRPITAGADLFRRKIIYYSYANVSGYTQESTGASLVTGFLVGKWSRAFLNYTYEIIKLSEADPADLTDPFFPGGGGHQLRAAVRPAPLRGLRPAQGEPDHPALRLQHGGQPVHPPGGYAPHRRASAPRTSSRQ